MVIFTFSHLGFPCKHKGYVFGLFLTDFSLLHWRPKQYSGLLRWNSAHKFFIGRFYYESVLEDFGLFV